MGKEVREKNQKAEEVAVAQLKDRLQFLNDVYFPGTDSEICTMIHDSSNDAHKYFEWKGSVAVIHWEKMPPPVIIGFAKAYQKDMRTLMRRMSHVLPSIRQIQYGGCPHDAAPRKLRATDIAIARTYKGLSWEDKLGVMLMINQDLKPDEAPDITSTNTDTAMERCPGFVGPERDEKSKAAKAALEQLRGRVEKFTRDYFPPFSSCGIREEIDNNYRIDSVSCQQVSEQHRLTSILKVYNVDEHGNAEFLWMKMPGELIETIALYHKQRIGRLLEVIAKNGIPLQPHLKRVCYPDEVERKLLAVDSSLARVFDKLSWEDQLEAVVIMYRNVDSPNMRMCQEWTNSLTPVINWSSVPEISKRRLTHCWILGGAGMQYEDLLETGGMTGYEFKQKFKGL
ncbi:MAG: hypothetical protein M1828_003029 [Chrysothrix sp. TS-e1954]|nr:MAG: hypothetical protein M1828_003029 [Chrysothrix sp. TS-e1954]